MRVRSRGLRHGTLAVTLATGLSACSLLPSHWWPAPAPPPELRFERITLRHLPCFGGGCPTYTVTVFGSGAVHYDGRHGVAVHGRRHGRATPVSLKRLRILLAEPQFYWMPERFVPLHENCGNWALDASTDILQLKSTHLHKHIVHYLGCHDAPALLGQIEHAVDAAAGDARWVSGVAADAGSGANARQ
ncbi:MAG TPA: DUF6438 domain-containing protein [Nevskiaceae bacterium]|nr:DUF6438 domain-containing protein [Nevskiaceae bacterium]